MLNHNVVLIRSYRCCVFYENTPWFRNHCHQLLETSYNQSQLEQEGAISSSVHIKLFFFKAACCLCLAIFFKSEAEVRLGAFEALSMNKAQKQIVNKVPS